MTIIVICLSRFLENKTQEFLQLSCAHQGLTAIIEQGHVMQKCVALTFSDCSRLEYWCSRLFALLKVLGYNCNQYLKRCQLRVLAIMLKVKSRFVGQL